MYFYHSLAIFLALWSPTILCNPIRNDLRLSQYPSPVFNGPSIGLDEYLQFTPKTDFEAALAGNSAINSDFARFIHNFVGPELSAKLGPQEVSQIIAEFERLNYELQRGVEELRQAKQLPLIQVIILGTVRFQKEHMQNTCQQWTAAAPSKHLCGYISALSAYYLWVHLCASLQYPPLIGSTCGVWPQHLFEEIHTFEAHLPLPGRLYNTA